MSTQRPELPSYYPERLTGPMRFGVRTPAGQINNGVIDSLQSSDLQKSAEEIFADNQTLIQPSIVASAFAGCDASCSSYIHVTGDQVVYTHTVALQAETLELSVSDVEQDPGETAVTLCLWKRKLHASGSSNG